MMVSYKRVAAISIKPYARLLYIIVVAADVYRQGKSVVEMVATSGHG
jgi:hypothetical protein